MHAAAAAPPPPPPPPPTLAIRDYPASTTDRSIHLGKFPAMPCARSSHARADMHAAAVVPPPLRPASFEPQVAPTPAGPQGRRRRVTNPDARAGWMPMDGGDLVVPVNSPPRPSPFPLLVSLPRCLTLSRESEEDIIGVHNRAGQKRKRRVDPACIFM
jgi:hypothetical protein